MKYYGYRKTGTFIYKELLPPGILAHSMTHGLSSFRFNEYLNEIVDVQPKVLGVFLKELTEKYFFNLPESKLKGFINHLTSKNDRIADFVFLKMLFKNTSNINTAAILSYVTHVLKTHGNYVDKEMMDEILVKVQNIRPSKYNIFFLSMIASHGKREDITKNIKNFLIETNSLETKFSIISFFNLNKQGLLTFEDKNRYFENLKLSDILNVDCFNRISEIYLSDEHHYPKFNEFITKNIDFIVN